MFGAEEGIRTLTGLLQTDFKNAESATTFAPTNHSNYWITSRRGFRKWDHAVPKVKDFNSSSQDRRPSNELSNPCRIVTSVTVEPTCQNRTYVYAKEHLMAHALTYW